MDPDGTKPVADGAPAGGGTPARPWHQEAFDTAPDAQLLTDAHGLVLEANQSAAFLLRCPPGSLVGKPLAMFGSPAGRRRFYDALALLKRGGAQDAFEARVLRRGEGERDVHVVARVNDGGGDSPTLHWLVRDVTAWKRAEAVRVELQRRLTTAQEDERRRVSRDLHDTVGQTLTGLALGVQAVRDSGPLPPAALERLDRVQALADELGRQLHGLATRLRPTALDDLGLDAAVRQLLVDWSARTGTPAAFQASAGRERFPPDVETALYRVVQESLTNAAKYAGARRVSVVIGRNGGDAVAVIEDDGVGFDPEAVGRSPDDRSRLGLLGMRERVALVGGTLEVESAPGQGTAVYARIPLAAPGGPG